MTAFAKLVPIILISAAACTSPPKPSYEIERTHKYDVSVYSGGKEVKDFNTALVKRINLSKGMVTALSGKQPLPVDGISETDRAGRVTGVRVVESKRGGNPAALGLREKDLITAVGTKPIRKIDDLRSIARDLAREQTSSLTIERNGRPHKILYFVSPS